MCRNRALRVHLTHLFAVHLVRFELPMLKTGMLPADTCGMWASGCGRVDVGEWMWAGGCGRVDMGEWMCTIVALRNVLAALVMSWLCQATQSYLL
jgi:hypothetical protein